MGWEPSQGASPRELRGSWPAQRDAASTSGLKVTKVDPYAGRPVAFGPFDAASGRKLTEVGRLRGAGAGEEGKLVGIMGGAVLLDPIHR